MNQPTSLDTQEERQSLAAMKRRGSPATRIVMVAVTLLVAAVSVFMVISYQQGQAEEQLVNAAGAHPQGSPEMLEALKNAWPDLSARDQKLRVIQNLVHIGDPSAGPIYLDALKDGGGIRRFAAIGLSRLAPEAPEGAVDALAEVLPDSDPLVDRSAVTWAIAVLGGDAPEAILEDFQAGRYQADDEISKDFDPAVVARALGPERLRSRALITHEEPSVRLLTTQALGELASPDVVEPLTELLQNELALAPEEQSREVIESSAAALGRTGAASAADILASVTAAHPSLRPAIKQQLRRTAGAPQLTVLLGRATRPEDRQAFVELLAQSRDPRGNDTLAELIEDPSQTVREAAVFALAEAQDPRAAVPLLAWVQGDDRNLAGRALDALAALDSQEASSQLVGLLPARCPDELEPSSPPLCFRRSAFLRALVPAASTAAAKRIEQALASPDATVAAVSLAAMKYQPAFRNLLRQASLPPGETMRATRPGERKLEQESLLLRRKGAIVALGLFGREEAKPVLRTIVEAEGRDDFALRSLAAQALGRLATRTELEDIAAAILDAANPSATRAYLAEALWQNPSADLKGAYLNIIRSTAPAAAKRNAAMALGAVLTETDQDTLISLLDIEASRPAAAIAILLGGSDASAASLLDWIETDRNLSDDLVTMLKPERQTPLGTVQTATLVSGGFWRRLRVADALHRGTEENRFSNAWTLITTLLKRDGNATQPSPGTLSPSALRTRMFEAMTGDSDALRRAAADAFRDAGEFGPLLRARDLGGPGAREARAALLSS